MTTTIWWIRRDLRLSDNRALTAALNQSDNVLPVFVLDPHLLNSGYVGGKRLAFLFGGLRQLAADLNRRGSRLIIRKGNPRTELQKLIAETGTSAIFAERDYSPYASRRDETIAGQLPLTLVNGLTVHPPGAVLKDDGSPYSVFTPFSRAWKALPQPQSDDLLPGPETIPTKVQLDSLDLPLEPKLPDTVPFQPGESEANRRFKKFMSHQVNDQLPLFEYADIRNRMDLDGTSGLSPYLRFGMISPRKLAVAAFEAIEAAPDGRAAKGATTWLNELIWREFYVAILHHFPQVRQSNFQDAYDDIQWDNNQEHFEAWQEGRTGYPVVDAAMRQLAHSGWVHNRARMIVASFLVKDLLIDWRWGEKFFMQHLVDGDPAANNGGWQWTAGTGTDAAPYFRVFNPVLQSQKFDPHGDYIRRWLPELASVPGKYIHKPWTMPGQTQREVGCQIGKDYPGPIVDHKRARERTLAAYNDAKG